MIQFKDVFLEFGDVPIFNGINFSINDGDKIALVGLNGSGKSTIFKLIMGTILPTDGEVVRSEKYTVGCVSQYFNYTKSTVIDEVCLALYDKDGEYKEGREYCEWEAEVILTGLKFKEQQINSDPNLLSGGFQVRLNLAKALLEKTDLLILDEPTNHLDIDTIEWLEGFIKEYKGAVIFTSHDRSFVDNLAKSTAFIHRKLIRKIKGPPQKIFDQIKVEEENYEKERIAQEEKYKKEMDLINRFSSVASKASSMQSRLKALQKMEVKQKLDHIPDLKFAFNCDDQVGDKSILIEADKVSFWFDESKKLFQDLSFKISKGDKLCVVGANGQGKSTLINVIHGSLPLKGGQIKTHQNLKVAYFGQMDSDKLDSDLSIIDELQKSFPEAELSNLYRAASIMLFRRDDVKKKISILSGGEKARVSLAKAVLTKANLLILDEPTNHLDLPSAEALTEALVSFPGAIIMVTHNKALLREIPNTMVVFEGAGKTKLFQGNYNLLERQDFWKNRVS